MEVSFSPLGDTAVVIEVADAITPKAKSDVQILSACLDLNSPEWMLEYVPAYTSVTVFYDPLKITRNNTLPYEIVCKEIRKMCNTLKGYEDPVSRTIKIPVCYGGTFGPDLDFVAKHNGLSNQDVIDIHTSGEYTVYMIGFAPGFPFLGGMSERIATPRRESPRLSIPERSVGIAGMQTGVYPIETPGGWQLIGRTPIRLFQAENKIPSLLRAGDNVVFFSINQKEYLNWKE
ncbi:5-oxoprolinase subunit PxpB [Oceanobacillus bengalensis]|uniref:5-oxoprolinase subunit PxpB n=1 Tax=Oceanobacillus bengalensis TaxID=1435466 RepID=A0A494Z3F4_9BACI|nr:5-oxoprolinase subunit PxpB [Oceanobacillus bengalensis]RKQ17059.1 5-oxoprolinase subunit PxpB [Oceanobacillus bengalensis]